ncbi:MAG: peptidoglycan bridge formation glycyltransferase FemA/FemB family protein [bacterium]|nr:peptidoglycan bridge formation glycyltransferase FemA/FemB family protein [bacterium]
MLKIVEITKKDEWDGFVFKYGHPLQMWGWGELKAQSPTWKVVRIFIKNVSEEPKKKEKYSDVVAAAQILIRKLPWPLRSFAYIPRGAVIISKKPQERAKILNFIAEYCQREIKPQPVALSIEPDWEEREFSGKELLEKGWKRAKNTILIPRTLILDLTQSEEKLMADMTKNNRQIVRKSSEKATVRQIKTPAELETALDIYEETAQRAGFAIHSRKYYQKLFELMGDNAPIYGAFVKNSTQKSRDRREETKQNLTQLEKIHDREELVGFSWIAKSQKTAFELYGGSNELGRSTRANYILKWLVLIQMKNAGIERYDMNGLLNDGISKFKSKFAHHENMLAGTFDKPLSGWYWLWSHGLPTFKKIIRTIKSR